MEIFRHFRRIWTFIRFFVKDLTFDRTFKKMRITQWIRDKKIHVNHPNIRTSLSNIYKWLSKVCTYIFTTSGFLQIILNYNNVFHVRLSLNDSCEVCIFNI
jgi:hypothetical protein